LGQGLLVLELNAVEFSVFQGGLCSLYFQGRHYPGFQSHIGQLKGVAGLLYLRF